MVDVYKIKKDFEGSNEEGNFKRRV